MSLRPSSRGSTRCRYSRGGTGTAVRGPRRVATV
nr:hypothetical protein HeiferVagina-S102_00069 [Bovine alphaherpesvirus 1]WHT50273.1 hypothetical protein Milk-S104_00069 [Bovine alphaherpesvirus 1]WHT50364.1 hypothetical protein Docile-S101_00072 [Bovine alphaherpesvirus 1]